MFCAFAALFQHPLQRAAAGFSPRLAGVPYPLFVVPNEYRAGLSEKYSTKR